MACPLKPVPALDVARLLFERYVFFWMGMCLVCLVCLVRALCFVYNEPVIVVVLSTPFLTSKSLFAPRLELIVAPHKM